MVYFSEGKHLSRHYDVMEGSGCCHMCSRLFFGTDGLIFPDPGSVGTCVSMDVTQLKRLASPKVIYLSKGAYIQRLVNTGDSSMTLPVSGLSRRLDEAFVETMIISTSLSAQLCLPFCSTSADPAYYLFFLSSLSSSSSFNKDLLIHFKREHI